MTDERMTDHPISLEEALERLDAELSAALERRDFVETLEVIREALARVESDEGWITDGTQPKEGEEVEVLTSWTSEGDDFFDDNHRWRPAKGPKA